MMTEAQHQLVFSLNNIISLNDDVVCRDDWTVETIKARTDRMVKEIVQMFEL